MHQPSPSQTPPETKGHREILAHKVLQEIKDHQELMVNQGTQDLRDQLGDQDRRALLELMDGLDLPVPLVDRENVECAPNTVHWMEEFSSKMEPAVKYFDHHRFWFESVSQDSRVLTFSRLY